MDIGNLKAKTRSLTQANARLKKFDKNHKSSKITIEANTVSFKAYGKIVRFAYASNYELKWVLQLVDRTFMRNAYSEFDVKSKVILDIGTNIGDTAILFALRGATHIYAIEPYPLAYKRAIKNIRINKMFEKITIENIGCGKKGVPIHIKNTHGSGLGLMLTDEKNGTEVNVLTLKDLLQAYGLDNVALKVDCEGCEYNILLNSPVDVLRKFEVMFIKYHHGYKGLLEKLASAGFNTRIIRPLSITPNGVASPKAIRGTILAKRQ